MLKIQMSAKNEEVVYRLSGRMDAENVAELQSVLSSEVDGRRRVLDLRELTLVDRDAVRFLERCEADRMKLKNCPAYVRTWILTERNSQ
jgi:anti-anti-sigma regulatory factor